MQDPGTRRVQRRAERVVESAAEGLLGFCGICLLAIAFVIGTGVLMNLLGVSRLVGFDASYWLVGDGVSFNTLLGLQVLLFAMAIMLAIAPVLLLDRHVRVDVLHGRLSGRARRGIELVGHAIFAIPFFGFLLVPAYRFVERSWRTGERSADGGLTDVYVIKAMLPVGILMVLVVLAYAVVRLLAPGMRKEERDA